MAADFTKRVVWVACFLLALSTTYALGQGIVSGSIAGTVLDPQKAVVTGAKVDAKNLATNVDFKSTTNDQGYFSLRSLPVGTYRVAVEAPNFKKLDVDGVIVQTGATTDMGALTLALGTTAETVTVEGAAPMIETTSAQGGETFTSATTADLPLNGGFDQMALLIPGVVSAGNAGIFANSNGASFGANGQRDRSNTFQIDGQFNNDTSVTGPAIFFGNQDALQEVQIVTNNFGVEYGRTSGATVNYVTKSGTNNFHGSGFEYFTGNWADSLTHQEKAADNPTVPRYVENRWGGTIGGPIIPNKIFFFASYLQDTAKGSSSPSTTTKLLPTPAGMSTLQSCYSSGLGSAAVAALTAIGPYSIAQGNPTPLGTPTLLNLGGSGGLAACPGVEFAGISRSLPNVFNDYEAVARVDFALSPRDQFFVRYLFTQPVFGGINGAIGQFGTPAEEGSLTNLTRNQQGALDWTRNWTTHLVNQVRFSYIRAANADGGGAYPNCSAGNLGACPTFYNLTGGLSPFGLGVNLPQSGLVNNSQWQDNASWQHGRHLIKFGGEYDRQRAPNVFLPFLNGRYTFTDAAGTPTATFNDFLAQNPAALGVNLTNAPSPIILFKEQDADLYIGDDWRIKDNITLNLGVRWEFTQQATNNLVQQTIANQSNPATRYWDPTLPLSLTALNSVPNRFTHFAPNFGFAWTPHMFSRLMGENKTVIRGGFRMAYDPQFYNIFLNVASAAPAVNAGTFSCPAPCPLGITGADVTASLIGLIPTGVNPGVRATTRISPNFTNPYAEEWTLGFEREISSKIAAEVRYVGTHTVKEFQTVNGNPALCASRGAGGSCVGGLFGDFPGLVPAGISPCATAGAPGFSRGYANCNNTLFRLRENGATGHYNSLQTQLKFRSWHGFSGGAAYTFSKNTDNASEIFSTYGPSAIAGPQNPFCTGACEKSLSALDFPHNLTIFWQYELPFGRGQSGAFARLLGGWALGGTYRYTSGQLWSPFEDSNTNPDCNDGFNNNYFGASACRPFFGNAAAPVASVGQCTNAALADCGLVDFNTGSAIAASGVHWIINDAVSAKFFGTPYGNTRRNPGVRGDPVNTINLNLIKNNRVSERVNLKLEANVFNLFNHQFLGVPGSDITSDGACFGSTACNDSGGTNFDSGVSPANAVGSGLAQRRIVIGAHIIF